MLSFFFTFPGVGHSNQLHQSNDGSAGGEDTGRRRGKDSWDANLLEQQTNKLEDLYRLPFISLHETRFQLTDQRVWVCVCVCVYLHWECSRPCLRLRLIHSDVIS